MGPLQPIIDNVEDPEPKDGINIFNIPSLGSALGTDEVRHGAVGYSTLQCRCD